MTAEQLIVYLKSRINVWEKQEEVAKSKGDDRSATIYHASKVEDEHVLAMLGVEE